MGHHRMGGLASLFHDYEWRVVMNLTTQLRKIADRINNLRKHDDPLVRNDAGLLAVDILRLLDQADATPRKELFYEQCGMTFLNSEEVTA